MKLNNFKIRLKRKYLNKEVYVNDAINSFIRPFKEMPSTNEPRKDTAGRINAHDLFSFYTADIIREDKVFAR